MQQPTFLGTPCCFKLVVLLVRDPESWGFNYEEGNAVPDQEA